MLAAWAIAPIGVAASLVDFARHHRVASLYLAVGLVAAHLLAFEQEMDGAAHRAVTALLWLLLGMLVVVEAVSLVRRAPASNEASNEA